MKKCFKKRKNAQENLDTIQSIQRLMDRITGSRSVETSNDGYVMAETPTPAGEFQSIGQTVVSIPPNSEQQRAHFQANRAYTTNLLLHAREELDEDSTFTDPSSVNIESELESDARL